MIKDQVSSLINSAITDAVQDHTLDFVDTPTILIEVPKNRQYGDLSTNIALVLAPVLNLPPREVAAAIVSKLPHESSAIIESTNIAGPGFINFVLKPDWLYDTVSEIMAEGDEYGKNQDGHGQKILVEYVSANPNGPITVAHGRNAAIGDAICALLEANGSSVTREHYINDALNSTQMNNFGKSVFLRYRELLGHEIVIDDVESDWFYRGDYVIDVARNIVSSQGPVFENETINDPKTAQTFRALSQDGMIAQQRKDLEAFGVHFDTWFNESHLHDSGKVAEAIKEMTSNGYTYERDGALWLKSTEFGDDKDRVLLRSGGAPTYIAADAAYHKDKLDRGFDSVIDILGADHAGYVARTKAVVAALGYDSSRITILLYQLVRIMKDGEFVKSSKRKGDVLELKADLIDEIGKDAARFFFLTRSPNTDLDIDIDLAKKTEKDNPVYYVQYAHARISQIIDRAKEDKGLTIRPGDRVNLSVLSEPSEVELMRKLSDYPAEVRTASSESAPQRIAQYARDLSSQFHTFYDTGNRDPDLRVLCDDREKALARVCLIASTRSVLKNALMLLGVSSPDRM